MTPEKETVDTVDQSSSLVLLGISIVGAILVIGAYTVF